jgi:hypothetical protein
MKAMFILAALVVSLILKTYFKIKIWDQAAIAINDTIPPAPDVCISFTQGK